MQALLHEWRRANPFAAMPDNDLLARYLATGDESAFAELVRRHGPSIYAACRRHLPDPADAADAFQAVWLLLVHRAGNLADRHTLGPWLFQVAVWTSRNLRRKNARRLAVTGPLPESLSDPSTDLVDLRLDLDGALAALPEKYRTPVVLCHLEGWSRREAAAYLGCPEGTLSALLSRALTKLRKRLGADVAPLLAVASVSVPAGLAEAAIHSAVIYRTASLSAIGVSPVVADLTRGVLRMFWVKKLVATGIAVAVMLGLGIGIGVHTDATAEATQPTPKADPSAKELQQRLKRLREEELSLEKQLDAAQRRELIEKQLLVFRQYREEQARLLEVYQHADVVVAPQLEVVLPPPAAKRPIEIREYQSGKPIGVVTCSTIEMSKRFLSRTHADPKGPKQVRVTADPECPWATVKELLDAVKAAGYESVSFSGRIPTSGHGNRIHGSGSLVVKSADRLVVRDREIVFSDDDILWVNEGTKRGPGHDWHGRITGPAYMIQSPDILKIEVALVHQSTGARSPLRQPLNDQFLVRPDGTVALGLYGSVAVDGMTQKQATDAIRKHLQDLIPKTGDAVADSELVVTLDVNGYQSKVYYVVIDGVGDNPAHRFAWTGNETILDAISQVAGLPGALSQHTIWIQRGEQTLPVDWKGIVENGSTSTNYQIQPGDRIFVRPVNRTP